MINCARSQYQARHGTAQTLNDLALHKLMLYAATLGKKCSGFEYLADNTDQSIPMGNRLHVPPMPRASVAVGCRRRVGRRPPGVSTARLQRSAPAAGAGVCKPAQLISARAGGHGLAHSSGDEIHKTLFIQ